LTTLRRLYAIQSCYKPVCLTLLYLNLSFCLHAVTSGAQIFIISGLCALYGGAKAMPRLFADSQAAIVCRSFTYEPICFIAQM
jgi:hypothetical protein